MKKIFSQYKHLDKTIIYLIGAEFFIQLIDYAYLTILLICMNKAGYEDYQSAGFFSLRFLSVLLLAFPLGFYIRGRKIRPLFYVSAIASPLLSLGIIYAIQYKMDMLIYTGMFLMGIAVLGLEVSILPYILRNVREKFHTEAISLSYSTASLSGIISGLMIFVLMQVDPVFFDEQMILKIISVISFSGIVFVYLSSKKRELYVPILKRSRYDLTDFDWWHVVKAMIPTVMIATGAGLAIPFMSLFFYKVHQVDSDQFAMLSSITTLVVFLSTLYVPNVKDKLGYKTTVVGSQSMAVLCLIVLSISEFYNEYTFAAAMAVFCYVFRQPLMNIAAPITSDVTMKFVGFRNREIVSALTAAIWSGSWFFSSNIFRVLRKYDVSYAHIFFITAALYVFSIFWYYYLIDMYEKEEAKYIKSKESNQ